MLDSMTNIKASEVLKEIKYYTEDLPPYSPDEVAEALEMAIKALETQPKPMEKFDDVKTHIQRLAGDYKCWDNRLTWEEALELNRMLEAQPNSNEFFNFDAPMVKKSEAVSREAVKDGMIKYGFHAPDMTVTEFVEDCLPSVKPKYTDEEIDKIQAVEQAYVDKMVEMTVEELRREWLNSFDTSSATKCFEAVNLLKQRLEGEE